MTFRTAAALMAVPIVLAASSTTARAQAWLPAQGEGAVTFVYQNMFDKYHQFPGIGKVDNGPTTSRSVLVDVTYGLTDKVAISFAIPWIASKYVGPSPHPLADVSGPTPRFYGVSPLDDGSFRGTFQDVRFDVRYNLTKKWLVLTPFIGTSGPTHGYATLAHASPGQALKQLQMGVAGAKMLDSVVPGLFVQGRYAYGIAEKKLDISHNRSNADLEVGYFVTPRLRVLAIGAGQVTHGGIDMVRNARVNLPPEQFLHHDQISRINFLNVGAGASYSVTERIDVFGSMIRTVAARNGHLIDRGLTVGLSWSFSAGRAKDRAIVRAEQSLARCACTKSAS
jgi:hypothetical protein